MRDLIARRKPEDCKRACSPVGEPIEYQAVRMRRCLQTLFDGLQKGQEPVLVGQPEVDYELIEAERDADGNRMFADSYSHIWPESELLYLTEEQASILRGMIDAERRETPPGHRKGIMEAAVRDGIEADLEGWIVRLRQELLDAIPDDYTVTLDYKIEKLEGPIKKPSFVIPEFLKDKAIPAFGGSHE